MAYYAFPGIYHLSIEEENITLEKRDKGGVRVFTIKSTEATDHLAPCLAEY